MRVVALTFQDGAPEGQERAGGARDAFYRIQAGELDRLLSQLRQRGYQTVSSKLFRGWPQSAAPMPKRAVMFMFAGGCASHFDIVASLLLRYRFSGTFFITTGRVGRPGYLAWEQLRKLVFLGMEIGSHGVSHQVLTALPPHELGEELLASKRVLEERLGIPVRALAAPGGVWNGTVAEAAKAAGYDAVWISAIGTNGKETNTLGLRRVSVHQPFSADRIIALVEGSKTSLWWAANQRLLIRALKRVLGVYWYEQLKRRLVPNA